MSGRGFTFLQKAVDAVLSTDATLAALPLGIYDNAPTGSSFPCLVYGEGRTQDVSTASARAERVKLDLAVFSRAGGRAEALAILTRLDALLHGASLSTSGATVTAPRIEASRISLDRDGVTWRGSATLTALVEYSL